ncbi:hypothetical protein [Chimaeribacter arupi]|uniref:Uncharacterized protein n=1 Tax=Chimaeribacter arupi TaxID=2060066 RepID=A0A2N5EJZ3_9GAMM|nr:hypothetical protein [Chimaeribacter arupi]MDV5142137.1 hypothetical protein [Chimaeribacter arupi]PLR30905.1 hypothetical protein CYR23_16790 [Chimaeribacter arupi]PLR46436.1 hypothetical protein CYR34_15780 [Chimaeribacter arupi]
MADPIITDIFRFVAVRPAELLTPARRALHFIADLRLTEPEGQRYLKVLARELATPAQALAWSAQQDRRPLPPLEAARDRLLAEYAALPATDTLPGFAEAGGAEALLDGQKPQTLRELAFDALYAAWMSGPDAGPRLQQPMDALRLLHFLQCYQDGLLTDVQSASAALQAQPLVPPALAEFVAAPGKDQALAAAEQAAAERDQHHAAVQALRPLFEEYAATETLLTAARQAPPARRPAETRSADGRTLTLTSLVPLGDVLAPASRTLMNRLSLADNTPLPRATAALQQHLQALTRDIAAQPDSPALRTLAQEYNLRALKPVIAAPRRIVVLPGAEQAADVEMGGRIRPLGIGDLLVVKQQLAAYLPGEVAHIENVLKGEFRERTHRTLDRTETILFSSLEENQETERDTQSTDRFELKKETEATLKEEMALSAGVTVSGQYGLVKITAQGDFAYKTAKEESSKNSSSFAQELVDRAVSKVQKKVKTERTDKTFHETEETNKHGIDNKDGSGHITGVYRWVDKKYHAQIYNYGCRLMLEFILPEPAAYYRASLIKAAVTATGAVPPVPFLDLNGQPLGIEDITEDNYQIFAGRYNAAVEPPPPYWTTASTSFDQSGIANGATVSKSIKDVVIPEGYRLAMFSLKVALTWENHPQCVVQVGEWAWHVLNNTHALQGSSSNYGFAPLDLNQLTDEPLAPSGNLPVSLVGYDINAYAVNLAANCVRTKEKYQKWQATAFEKIYSAWLALKTAYDQKIAQAEAQAGAVIIEGRNPAANREIEQRELKKLCITMMTGQHFNQFNAMTSPADQPAHLPELKPLEALSEGRYIQFFEQAFDWPQLTYLFYPYFWGRKKNWVSTSNLTDPDPLFAQFLQAGAARVIVPVPLAYSTAVLYFLQKTTPPLPVSSKLWLGGEAPTLDDPQFTSIAYEIRKRTDDLYGAVPVEPKAQNGWDFTLPTTLVWLQSDATLPTYPVTL